MTSLVIFFCGVLIGLLLGGFVGFFFADKRDEAERIRFWKSFEEDPDE